MKRTALILTFTTVLILATAIPAKGQTLSQCLQTSLRSNGVARNQASLVAQSVEQHINKKRSRQSLLIRTRRNAESVSRDQSWINWAVWVVGNAYDSCVN